LKKVIPVQVTRNSKEFTGIWNSGLENASKPGCRDSDLLLEIHKVQVVTSGWALWLENLQRNEQDEQQMTGV